MMAINICDHCEPTTETAEGSKVYSLNGEKLNAAMRDIAEPQVGEWWWYEWLDGQTDVAEVLGRDGNRFVLSVDGARRPFVRERKRLVCRAGEKDIPKPGLFARLWAWVFGS